MATGDQSGTWGDTTNTNLGTLLEQAITGYLSVAQGDVANLTLTTVNGGTDQARNAVVNVTGALTAARNVVVQTANKMYVIVNATTGGFSIVAKTAAGTGVSIPPGASVLVYSDGTNVVQAANYANGQIGGMIYLDSGATVGPVMDLFRDSTSPAASDILGRVIFNGRDSAGNKQEYASIESSILSASSTTESGKLEFYVVEAGARTLYLQFNGLTQVVNIAKPLGSKLDLGSIGQIQFPATQNPSSDANTLDDYEEGISVPTVALTTPGTSSIAYTTQTCSYTKIGNVVTFVLTLNFTPTIGTGSGNLIIATNLPANPGTITPLSVAAMNSSWSWPASRTMVCATIGTTGSISIEGDGSGASAATFGATNLTGGVGHVIRISGSYVG